MSLVHHSDMKHENLWKSTIAELYEAWMDDADKAFFYADMTGLYGVAFDAAIDAGLAMGHTEEDQKKAFLKVLRRA